MTNHPDSPLDMDGKNWPDWLVDMDRNWRGCVARLFILHFNINDYVLPIKEPHAGSTTSDSRTPSMLEYPLLTRPFLHFFLREVERFQTVVTYSLTSGLGEEDLRQTAVLPAGIRERVEPTPDRGRGSGTQLILKDDREAERQRGWERIEADLRRLHDVLRATTDIPVSSKGYPKVAVIIDHLDRLVPTDAERGSSHVQSFTLETLRRWAQDPYIRFKTDHIVLMLTDNIDQVARSLREDSGCLCLKVDRPNEDEREQFLRLMRDGRVGDSVLQDLADDLLPEHTQPADNMQDQKIIELAKLGRGLNLVDLDNLNRRVGVENLDRKRRHKGTIPLDRDDVREAKSEVIKAQSEGLLEVCTPVNSFADVGGLDHIKRYLRRQCDLLRDRSPETHRGIILVGPPGTGKSIIAEALATESGVSLVKMREIREMWVGQSERNLALALNLIEAMSPVVVFVDEVDQALGGRDTGISGDAGTSARMFGRILEFMGLNKYCGKIFWVAASNRPDLLDAALLRRFDMVVPMLLPSKEECCLIFKVMPRVIRNLDRPEGQRDAQTEFYAQGVCLRDQPGAPQPGTASGCSDVPACPAQRAEQARLTGADIEKIVRRARDISREKPEGGSAQVTEEDLLEALDDYKPNHDLDEYTLQSLVALQCANFHSMMPQTRAGGERPAGLALPPILDPLVMVDERGKERELPLFADGRRDRLDPVKLERAIEALRLKRTRSRALGR